MYGCESGTSGVLAKVTYHEFRDGVNVKLDHTNSYVYMLRVISMI